MSAFARTVAKSRRPVADSLERGRKMARPNRLQVPDGTYHVTTRIVGRQFWLKDPDLKDGFVEDLYGAARFSGVELLSWTVMDNHLHLHVLIPTVPRGYWLDPNVEPAAYAFGMRPPANRPPLWSPAGDGPSVPGGGPLPPVAFTLPDGEMEARLAALYGPACARRVLDSWARLRAEGGAAAAESAKSAYCRRMYNLSQFVKTVKERLARRVKGHLLRRHGIVQAGHVFEDRFHSGVVQASRANPLVQLYIDYNPVRAGIVHDAGDYRWSSFGRAVSGGAHAAECRAAYERVWGCPWEEALARIRAAFSERTPDELEERLAELDVRFPGARPRGKGTDGCGRPGAAAGSAGTDGQAPSPVAASAPSAPSAGPARRGAAAETPVPPRKMVFGEFVRQSRREMNGQFIGADPSFAAACAARVNGRFPHGSVRSLVWLADNVAWPSAKSA